MGQTEGERTVELLRVTLTWLDRELKVTCVELDEVEEEEREVGEEDASSSFNFFVIYRTC